MEKYKTMPRGALLMQSLIVKEIKFIEINCDIDLYFFAISVHLRRVRIYLTSIIEVRTSNGQIKNKKDGQIKNDIMHPFLQIPLKLDKNAIQFIKDVNNSLCIERINPMYSLLTLDEVL